MALVKCNSHVGTVPKKNYVFLQVRKAVKVRFSSMPTCSLGMVVVPVALADVFLHRMINYFANAEPNASSNVLFFLTPLA